MGDPLCEKEIWLMVSLNNDDDDNNNNNNNNASTYIIESPNIWHVRLGHVNYRCLHRMCNLGLLFTFDLNHNYKCEICIEAKFDEKLLC